MRGTGAGAPAGNRPSPESPLPASGPAAEKGPGFPGPFPIPPGTDVVPGAFCHAVLFPSAPAKAAVALQQVVVGQKRPRAARTAGRCRCGVCSRNLLHAAFRFFPQGKGLRLRTQGRNSGGGSVFGAGPPEEKEPVATVRIFLRIDGYGGLLLRIGGFVPVLCGRFCPVLPGLLFGPCPFPCLRPGPLFGLLRGPPRAPRILRARCRACTG